MDHYDFARIIFRRLGRLEARIMAMFDGLIAEVAKLKDVDDSAVALIQGLVVRLEAASGNQAQLDAVIADIKAQTAKMGDAVAVNTPADPNAQPPLAARRP